jgi:DNA-binding CsgD family transcriptional regulator
MNISTLDYSTTYHAELIALNEQIVALNTQLHELQQDIVFIKQFVLAKLAKKEKRRQKREQKRLEEQRAKKAKEDRSRYERIVWQMGYRHWDFMPPATSELSPKELELVSLLAQNKTEKEIAECMQLKENSVNPRICAANGKLGFNSREKLRIPLKPALQCTETGRYSTVGSKG